MKSLSLLAAGAALSIMTGAVAQPASAPPAEVTIPNSRVIDFVSSVNKHRYRINIALPDVPPPPQGYRVLYLFDGNGYFGSVAEAVRMNGNAVDVVVVGIGYPDTPEFISDSEARYPAPVGMLAQVPPRMRARMRERTYDLSLPMSDAVLAEETPAALGTRSAREVGGIDELLKTIEQDVKPRVAALTTIDAKNQALFGHSLGGLAVLRALFTEPGAFRTFIAASPSIWWGNRAVLAGETGFTATVAAGKASPRVLITMGSEEGAMPSKLPPGYDKAQVAKMMERSRMVDNARELAARLAAIKGAPGYQVGDYAVFAQQGHGISVWPAIGRAVEFAFQQP
jgi:predicted alpha/beta superfamily hydrolase